MTPPRRKRLQLLFRDLAAAAAFLSIALSGSVPAWCLAIFALGLLLSLTGVRPLSARGAVSATLLVALALGLAFAVARQGLDLVVAATVFASLVAAQRMVSAPSPTTDQQVHLTSLLLLAGGAALSGELWYALCLGGFALFACLSMGLSVIEGPQVADEVLPVRPVLRQLGVAVALAFAGALAFFVLFPRLSWNLAQRPNSPGLLGNTTGMSDRVRLGGGGDLKVSPRVVARIALEPTPSGDQLDAYWPGRFFERFDGREWSGGGQERAPTPRVLLDARARRGTTQQIELLPAYGARTLIALNAPYQFSNGQAVGPRGARRVSFVEVVGEEVHFRDDAQAYSYVAVSLPEGSLAAAEQTSSERERFVALPPSLDPRVGALAEQLLGEERRPEVAASRIISWLRKNQEYTLELPGELDDPLVDFLFQRKRGHCEHFATALAVLLRSRGIPARLVGGFYGGERVGEGFVLRGGDAHAWTQVFVEGKGWVTYDATPESGRKAQSSRVLAWLTGLYEELDALWRTRVIDYTFQDQFVFVRNLVRPPVERGDRQRLSVSNLPGLRAWLAAAAAGLAVYLLWRRLLRPRARPHRATRFLDALEARLKALELGREPDEPLEELSRRLAQEGHPLARALEDATRAYLASRFAGAPLSPSEEKALLSALALRP